MNLLDRTFTDSAWYWPLIGNNPDGTKRYDDPSFVVGRWNDSPFVVVKPNEERVQIGGMFRTTAPIQAGGWLLLSKYIDPTLDPTTIDPHTNKWAREIDTVSSSYPYDQSVTYYTGNLK